MTTEDKFGSWAVLELFGHRRLGGYVTEQTIGGGAFIRIDIPAIDDEPAVTQFYGPAAVFSLTPTSEEAAVAVARRNRPEPVHQWELPKLPAAVAAVVARAYPDTDGLDDITNPDDLPFD